MRDSGAETRDDDTRRSTNNFVVDSSCLALGYSSTRETVRGTLHRHGDWALKEFNPKLFDLKSNLSLDMKIDPKSITRAFLGASETGLDTTRPVEWILTC